MYNIGTDVQIFTYVYIIICMCADVLWSMIVISGLGKTRII